MKWFAFLFVLIALTACQPATAPPFSISATPARLGVLGVTPVPLAPGDVLNVQATGGNIAVNGTPLASGNAAIANVTWTPTATNTPTATGTSTFTPTRTNTPTSTATRTSTATSTVTNTPTSTPTSTATPTTTAIFFPFIAINNPPPTPVEMIQEPLIMIRAVDSANNFKNGIVVKFEICDMAGIVSCTSYNTLVTMTTYDLIIRGRVYPGSAPHVVTGDHWYRVTVGAASPLEFYWGTEMYRQFTVIQ